MPPTSDATISEHLRAAERALAGSGVVLTTSGSTGQPKSVVLSADALRASAAATAERIGGPGQWLLTLPTDHVAGWQVMVRSALAGTVPARLDGSFTVAAFTAAAATLTGRRRYVSLVPTQVVRLAEDLAGLATLATFDAVLVGGAALPTSVRERTEAAGIRVHRTYGMTETSGGCVYDGTPLPGVGIRLDEGRVRLSGSVLATEYAGDPHLTAERFVTDDDGRRWFVTDDVGELDVQGRLHLLGRMDDLINTGGFKVAPRPVEDALLGLPQIRDALVLGVPDAEWGERVAAVLVAQTPHAHTPHAQHPHTLGGDAEARGARPGVSDIRDLVRDVLPAHALPRQVLWVEELPLLRSGKPDRAALRAMCAGESGTMDPYRGSAD